MACKSTRRGSTNKGVARSTRFGTPCACGNDDVEGTGHHATGAVSGHQESKMHRTAGGQDDARCAKGRSRKCCHGLGFSARVPEWRQMPSPSRIVMLIAYIYMFGGGCAINQIFAKSHPPRGVPALASTTSVETRRKLLPLDRNGPCQGFGDNLLRIVAQIGVDNSLGPEMAFELAHLVRSGDTFLVKAFADLKAV